MGDQSVPESAYTLLRPKDQTTSVVFASPHSGRDYPMWFLKKSVLDERTIRSSEDAFVDRLFERAPSFGAPLLLAGAPRAFVDLNRATDELDPALIEDLRKSVHNPRVASGLGIVPRVVSNGRPIYNGKISLEEAHARISDYWQPYHDRLQALLDEARGTFGRALLIDCHSMPHEAIENSRGGARRADVVLGDRFGAAASSDIVECIEAAFTNAGLRVARNAPFAGAFIAQQYGRPSRGQHVVQVEIDRSLYMDEAKIAPNANFAAFRALITQVVEEVCEIGRPMVQLAAE
ncbi:MAG: N-formylglutamate amidohydrolase [Pseudomonadota bacterium]